MEGERAYLVPDYFPEFHCKMGACRRPCCEGWPVSITMTDYFRLIGLDCSQELRRRLDCCLHIAPHPSPEAYAQITPRYDGHCPLHMEDGRCALHAELGEGVLAAVCRLYPRGARTGEFHECSCANSCEAVPELLLHRDAPLRFINVPLAPGLPEAPERRHDFHTEGREQEIRLWLISFLQRRDFPLSRRMLHLGNALHAMDDALQARDSARVAAQIVAGVGFLGAGMIVYKQHEVHGLTTAAGIWATAGVGMAAGGRLYLVAVGATAIMVIAQCIFHLPFKAFHSKRFFSVKIEFVHASDENVKIKEIFGTDRFNELVLKRDGDKIVYSATLNTDKEFSSTRLNQIIAENPFICSIERVENS